jgi:hypothetical protein
LLNLKSSPTTVLGRGGFRMSRVMIRFSLFAFVAALFAAQPSHALAMNLAMPMPTANMSYANAPRSFNTAYNFEGIVALNNCSGSLIALENSLPGDMAMVLTNGHCYEGGFLQPGQFLTGIQSTRAFALYDSKLNKVARLRASQIMYSSMTTTDITLYRLTMSYQDIAANYNIHPLILSSKHPVVGTPINVLSGYWERGFSCQIAGFVPTLHEGNWQWTDSVRYSQPGCEVIGGTSGSPVIQDGTNTLIAINNTVNENGQRCTVNNPCETDAQGNVSYAKGNGYAQQTYIIYTCLNANKEIDLSRPGCMLFHN